MNSEFEPTSISEIFAYATSRSHQLRSADGEETCAVGLSEESIPCQSTRARIAFGNAMRVGGPCVTDNVSSASQTDNVVLADFLESFAYVLPAIIAAVIAYIPYRRRKENVYLRKRKERRERKRSRVTPNDKSEDWSSELDWGSDENY